MIKFIKSLFYNSDPKKYRIKRKDGMWVDSIILENQHFENINTGIRGFYPPQTNFSNCKKSALKAEESYADAIIEFLGDGATKHLVYW